MIKKLTIKNFKAIRCLSVYFTPLTILIGENSCGKSTVLQALDFLCSIASRDIDEYLKDRDWDFSEVKSQFAAPAEDISFSSEFEIENFKLLWNISINNNLGKWIIRERIHDIETGDSLLSFGNEITDIPYDFSQLNIKSSALKMIDVERDDSKISYHTALVKLKGMLINSSSFELLSPDRMRSRGSRGKVNSIGMGGEKLAAYIHGMHSTKRGELNRTVSEFIGYDVKITTTTTGQPGWVEMFMEEIWQKNTVKIKKRYISDGLLRIIAFAAILSNQDSKRSGQLSLYSDERTPKGFIMLDEIEDGINPILSEKLIARFTKLAEEYKNQIILTSHSPVMVNYTNEESIQFMWRDEHGMIHAEPLFKTKEMKETLEFLNPGEVWLNYSKESIIEKISSIKEE